MAMCTVAQARIDAPCHCYTRLRALTASRVRPATTPKKLLQCYCKSCMLCPAQRALPFACTHETFQAGSRQQPQSSRRTPYEHALPPRDGRVFRSILWPQREESVSVDGIHCHHHNMFDSYLHLTCRAAPHVERAVNTSSSRMPRLS